MEKQIKYTPTKLPWLPQIPIDWSLHKFNRVAFYQEGPGLRNWQFTEEGVKVICVTNITEKGIDFSLLTRNISQKEYDSTYKHFTVSKGDYLLASSGASWGKVSEYEADEKVILNTSTIRINTLDNKILDRKFLKWLIKSPYISEHLNNLLTGSCQPNFGPTHLSQLFVAIPNDIKQQEKIAAFLNAKTIEVDNIISKKQKLIECLKEERIEIISQILTTGISSNTELQPSGIEWLGNIPKHWQLKKLKYIVSKVGSGVTPNGGASVYIEEGIPLIRSQNIYNDGLRLEDVAYISEKIDAQMKNSRIEEGDVLLNVTGASIGRCYFIPKGFGNGNVNQHVCIIRPVQSIIETQYLYLVLISKIGQLQINLHQTGANREGLNFEQIKNFVLPLPSKNEQTEIMNYIKTQTEKIDNTVFKVQQEIELIKEYKTSLINEVVTGKIILN